MEWTRSETLALAVPTARIALGRAYASLKKRRTARMQLRVARDLPGVLTPGFAMRNQREVPEQGVRWIAPSRGGARRVWGRKDENTSPISRSFSRRSLTPEEYKLFSFHSCSAPIGVCAARLNIDRGNFFHSVYRIERNW